MSLSGAAAGVAEAIETAPVVDAHAHLRPIADLRPMTFTKLLDDSFVHLNLRVSDGSPNALGSALELPLVDDSWETVARVKQLTETNSFYRWLVAGATALHDIDGAELTPSVWQQLTRGLSAAYDTEEWLTRTLDRAHIEHVVWDPFWRPGETAVPEPRVIPALRVSSAMAAYHPHATDYEGTNLVADWAHRFRTDVTTLDRLEALLDVVLRANLEIGARALKIPIAYERTLIIQPATRKEALRIFGRSPETVSAEDRIRFGDYMLRFLLDRARDHRLVVQVHLGLARLEYSSPLQIVPLLREYPDLVFDLLHGGYPWIHETGALAHSYPNVRLNLVWLPLLSTDAAVRALREWIQLTPQVDRICWGSDARTPEETFGALLAGKDTIARAVGALVDHRYFSAATGIEVAHSILAGAARTIYRLPPAGHEADDRGRG